MYFSKIAAALTVGLLLSAGYSKAQNNPDANPVSVSIDAGGSSSIPLNVTRTITIQIGNNGSNLIPADGAYWTVSFPNTVTVNQSSLNLDGGPFSATWSVNGGGTILFLQVIAPGIPANVTSGPRTTYNMTVNVVGSTVSGPLQLTVNAVNDALIAGNLNTGDDNASSPLSVTSSPLPVSLTNFGVTPRGCTAALGWTTVMEQNIDRFEVEVSNDGKSYQKAGVVAAAGTSNVEKHYSFNYDMTADVSYLFRLKMVEKDGSHHYSQSVKASCSQNDIPVTVAPNPVLTHVAVKGLALGQTSINIVDVKGSIVHSETTARGELDLNLAALPSGVYTLVIREQSGTVYRTKLIKQ